MAAVTMSILIVAPEQGKCAPPRREASTVRRHDGKWRAYREGYRRIESDFSAAAALLQSENTFLVDPLARGGRAYFAISLPRIDESGEAMRMLQQALSMPRHMPSLDTKAEALVDAIQEVNARNVQLTVLSQWLGARRVFDPAYWARAAGLVPKMVAALQKAEKARRDFGDALDER